MFITGLFTATYAGTSLGQTEQGWEIQERHQFDPILTDAGGDSPVDAVMRGSIVEVRATYVDYDLIKACLYAANTQGKAYANVGKLLTNLAGILVLTPQAGSSAASDLGAANITFHRAIVANDINTLLSTRHRKGPISFLCYPSVVQSGEIYALGGSGS